MSKEEAEANEILEHRSYLTFEKEINPVKKTNDIKNTTWFNEIEEIYHTFSLIVNDKYTPGSRKEIKNAKIEVSKLKCKYSGNVDFCKYKTSSSVELVSKGVLPNIDGLYDNSKNLINGVIISHPHQDQYGLANFINENVPYHLGEATYKIIELNNLFTPQERI